MLLLAMTGVVGRNAKILVFENLVAVSLIAENVGGWPGVEVL